MKWRIVLTVLVVLALFAGFAYFYVNTFVRKHQHGVILFVVNGLDLNTLHLARQQANRAPLTADLDDPDQGDARRRSASRSSALNLDTFWDAALLTVQETGQPVPDEGADATALACGSRVDNGLVAINNRAEPLRSLIYAAEQANRGTGLVTTSSLVAPTPVAFYSNIRGTPDPERNATDLVYSGIDIVLGGGESWFGPASTANENGRHDGRNLFDEARSRGYDVVRSRDQLNNVSWWRTRQVLGLFANDGFFYSALQPVVHRQPSLAEMTRAAISCLNYDINGYFLVVEDGLVAESSSRNLGKLSVNEVAALDEAIQAAVDYAGPDALVIVTNNYNLGSVAAAVAPPAPPLVEPVPVPIKAGTAVAASAPAPPAPSPAALWLSGPGGPAAPGDQEAWLREQYEAGAFSTNAPGLLQPQTAFRFATEAAPLAQPAWLIARGTGSNQFRGFFDNTDVFDLIQEQF